MVRTNYHYIYARYGVSTARVWYVDGQRRASVVASGAAFAGVTMHGVPARVVGRVLAVGCG